MRLPGWRRTDVVAVRARAVRDRPGPRRPRRDPRVRQGVRARSRAAASVAALRHRRVAEALRRTGRPGLRSRLPWRWSDARRLLLMEAMPGRPWSALAGDQLARAMASASASPSPLLHGSAPAGRPAGLRPAPARTGSRTAPTSSAGPGPTSPRHAERLAAASRASSRSPTEPRSSCTATAIPATRSSTGRGGPDRPRPDGRRPGGRRPRQPARPAALRGDGRRARCRRGGRPARPASWPGTPSAARSRRRRHWRGTPPPRCSPSAPCAPSTGSTGAALADLRRAASPPPTRPWTEECPDEPAPGCCSTASTRSAWATSPGRWRSPTRSPALRRDAAQRRPPPAGHQAAPRACGS